jgi:3-hydroxybutyryl-CoA dehydratase
MDTRPDDRNAVQSRLFGCDLDDAEYSLHNSFQDHPTNFLAPPRKSHQGILGFGAVSVSRHTVSTLFFEDLVVGDEWESPSRTVTQAEVTGFAGLSGDFNPLHMDHEAARNGPFGKPVAHGLLGLAIASGLTSQSPRVETLAFLAIKEWKFLHPINFGDTIRVITRVEALEPRSRGRRGVVTWHRRLVDHQGKTLQEGSTQTLVRGRSRSEPSREDGASSVAQGE